MNLRGVFIFAVGGFVSTATLAAADAAKVDYTQRNEPFAPAAGVTPEKRSPEHNRTVQDRRVAPSVTNPAGSVPSERRSPIDLAETKEKRVLAPEIQQPTVRAPELSPFDHRESRFNTAGSTEKPKLVTRPMPRRRSVRRRSARIRPPASTGSSFGAMAPLPQTAQCPLAALRPPPAPSRAPSHEPFPRAPV